MCGILGQIEVHQPISEGQFRTQLNSLTHRGPDGEGLWLSPDKRVALGHRRLSFVDLSQAAAQPIADVEQTVWLTCNGEIYNAPELRQQLSALGHRFRSQSDNEVILHGYKAWGAAGVLGRLKGMFAFGLWDAQNQQLLLARDRFGIKPLYYTADREGLSFASELKAFVGSRFPLRLRKAAISEYLTYRYIPSPGTIYQGFFKLKPGHYLTWKPGEQVHTHQWYSPQVDDQWLHPDEAALRVEELLRKSVAQHLTSDVELGSFLSGGYDSSALACLMTESGAKPQVFSIGFQGWAQSEDHYAAQVAEKLGLNQHVHRLGLEDYTTLSRLAEVYDEPIADISILPTYAVSQLARREVKGVFSGEGADEIFAGYHWHRDYMQFTAALAPVQKFVLRLAPQFFQRSPLACGSRYAQYMAMGLFDEDRLDKTLTPEYTQARAADPFWFYRQHARPELHPLQQMQWLDLHTFMPELILVKMDRASMANSLEVRVPFLDHELVNFMLGLHPSVYFRWNTPKSLLHKYLKGRVPNSILQRKKQGFVGPDAYYAQPEPYRKELPNGALIQQGILRPEALNKLLNEPDTHWHLWKLLVLEHWVRRWL